MKRYSDKEILLSSVAICVGCISLFSMNDDRLLVISVNSIVSRTFGNSKRD